MSLRPFACLLVAALALVFPYPIAEVSAAEEPIQPGVRSTHGDTACTLNFVFDGVGALAGKVYIGTAAHCVERVGQSVSTDAHPSFGTVAFLGNEDITERDYALIEVKPAFQDLVRTEVVGHAAPTGSTVDDETYSGDVLRFSGYGMGFGTTSATREERVGVHVSDDASMYVAEGPIIFGDSGGPILHQSGKAYGVVSRISAGVGSFYGTWIEGPTVEGILSDSSARGFPVQLRV